MAVYLLYLFAALIVIILGIYVIFRNLHLEAKLTVPYSKAQVWHVLEDPLFLATWDRSVQEVIPTSTGPIDVGYTFETIAPKQSGQEEGLRMLYRIIEFEPNHHVTISLEQSEMFNNARWIVQVDDSPQGTLITHTMEAEVRFKYFYLVPVLLLNRQALITDMDYLRAALDKEISGL